MATVAQAAPSQNITWHPYVTHDALAERTSNRRAELGWRFLATVTFVAFTALVAVAAAFTAVDSLFITLAVFALFGFPFSFRLFKIFWDKANARGQVVEFNDRLLAKLQVLPSDAKELRKTVENMGVKTEKLSDQDLQKAKHAIARAQTLVEVSDNNIKEIQKELDEKTVTLEIDEKPVKVEVEKAYAFDDLDLSKPESLIIYQKLSDRKIRILNDLQDALLDRISAAYCLHVIQNPHDLIPPNKFYQIHKIDCALRYHANAEGNDTWDVLLQRMPRTHVKELWYTIDECKDDSAAKIAEQVFG